ncbi:UDP-N-acetylmuramate--L-alanine ligase [Actinidia chinensis var. chinensis]|uniref:UDP-N-acetylmuramate--L-alanine ligase n=1 Tax=Actinidia chinensis var. chinensis TaxID=1590841 RepID=A0A2R6Q911_ACTCC|nr:UDP-N-acetylmuramate--L-alanine ligase [Actinidia chinensis var. chinensis]
MELPATSPSTYRNRPALSRRNPRPSDLLLRGGVGLGCVSNHVRARVPTSEERDRRVSVSVSVRCTDREAVDLCHRKEKDWLHFVGVGGCGLSALAMLALKQGYEVSGSDIGWSSFMDGLQEAGARLYVGHSVTNMQKHNGLILPKAIVVSSAIPQDNVEILYANSVELPIYKRDYWLAKLTEHYNLIAVSGTHGKSTTASMLAYVLQAMGDDVTAVVGAHVPQFDGGNIISGSSQNFVLEADEYDGCFLGLLPYITVVTNVELEHVDIFEDEAAVIAIFRRFLKQIRAGGHLILCGDSVGARSLLGHRKQVNGSDYYNPAKSSLEPCSDSYRVTTYGISSSNEWHASSLRSNLQGGTDYKLCHRGCPVADISLQIPGVHNVLNSLAVIATVSALFGDHRHIHESVDLVRLHLNSFKGISRRFEMIGSVRGCHIFDDYAHHPTEVRAVIQAARHIFRQKDLLVVFQPHTYSRLAALKNKFATALSDADLVVVTEIYGSRETNLWNISGWHLATSITGPPSEYIPSLEDVVDKLALYICKDPDRETLILTLGAGDITFVGRKLLHELQQILPKANS